ncbi:hypothetical protein CBR_g26360 [Chara braunii]|uniref:3'-5' exonuclease domain-containing protein n=1 Tax=Chara braunii TaxID=69332 RepID=A0A388L7N0_CHABU|nr:hypothetical protein CBR_g26360 [Chara braunii]|eukprot:GBG78331.1 hypothetical protein CBR_g26360 [Chara braunii]
MPPLARSSGRLRVARAKANGDNGSGVSSSKLPALAQTPFPKELFDRLNPSEVDRSNPCVRSSGGAVAHGARHPFLSKAEALPQSSASPDPQRERSGGQSRAGHVEGCVKAAKQRKKRKKSSNDALIWPEVAGGLNGLSSAEAQASREADNRIANEKNGCGKRRKETDADSKKSKSNLDGSGRGEGEGEEGSHPSTQLCKPLTFGKRRKETDAESKKSKSNFDRRGRGEGEGEEALAVDKRRKETDAESKKSKSNLDRRGRGEGGREEGSHPSNQLCKPVAFDTAWGPFLCGEDGIKQGTRSEGTAADLLESQLEVTVSREASVVDAWLDRLVEEEQRSDGRVLGLDIEWTPCYMKGQYNPAALLQLSSATRCLIVQLLHMDRRSQKLVGLFAPSSQFRFAGVGVRDDLTRLTADHFMPPCEEKAVDLGTLAAKVLGKPDVRGWGLKALGREVLSYEMQKPKKVCMSRWGSRLLSVEQVRYASLDAWVSYLIWKALDSLPTDPGKMMS